MTHLQSLHKRWVEITGLGAIRNVSETVKIIMQLPWNTGLSNSLDYKIPDFILFPKLLDFLILSFSCWLNS